jgi:hypothetical protein
MDLHLFFLEALTLFLNSFLMFISVASTQDDVLNGRG